MTVKYYRRRITYVDTFAYDRGFFFLVMIVCEYSNFFLFLYFAVVLPCVAVVPWTLASED
jgi:hypothetical protein